MLLTSGQISMGISSIIVFTFSSILFLSGYVIQQRTVHELQAAIHPPIVSHHASSSSSLSYDAQIRLHRGSAPQHHLALRPNIDWSRAAYVQIVRDYVEVCNAVMVFAALARQKSPAQRLLLYPAVWNREMMEADHNGKGKIKRLATAIALIERAAVRHNVTFLPIESLAMADDETLHESSGSSSSSKESAYPLAGLLSLTDWESLLYLQPSGLVLDAEPLDSLFGVAGGNASVVSFAESVAVSPIVLLRPSMDAFRQVIATQNRAIPSHLTMPIPHNRMSSRVYFKTSDLVYELEGFNASAFLDSVAYVRLSDASILGPDYDIPRKVFLAARPSEDEPRMVWEELYERYRIGRMEMCNLDLESLPDGAAV